MSTKPRTLATEQLEHRHRGNDTEIVDDIVMVPVPGGQQKHPMLWKVEAVKTTKETQQDPVMKALSEKDPDAVVTPSATVFEQEADTKADAEESMGFVMRMCHIAE